VSTGTATPVGLIPDEPNFDGSAMAFDDSGTLFVLDNFGDQLATIDKTDGSIVAFVALSEQLGKQSGMDFDLRTGLLYVADGGTDGTDNLYTLDPTTGVLTMIGPTGLPKGVSGLELTLDFGDASAPYPTLFADDGARHVLFGPTLGTNRDSESDGTHSLAADADDNSGTADDEDGVTFDLIRVGQLDAQITVNVQNAPVLLLPIRYSRWMSTAIRMSTC